MDKFFKLTERHTDVRTEVIAGITTFLSMVYILAVNPAMLEAGGMDKASVFTATAIAGAFTTLLMGLYANYPIALCTGMGLNAYFAYTICGGLAAQGVQNPWTVALTAVLCEGIIFVLISLTKFREQFVNSVPQVLRSAIIVGVGLFITICGMVNAGIMQAAPSTLVTLGNLGSPQVVLAMAGVIIIALLAHFHVRGHILLGILATWILGMIAQAAGWYQVDPEAGAYSLYPVFTGSFIPVDKHVFDFYFGWALEHIVTFTTIAFTLLLIDLFDTVGALIGIAPKANLVDENGDFIDARKAFLTDSIGTVFGACAGTSTVTGFIESSTGVASGGRTGLTSVTTGLLFIAALFFSPIFLAIPMFATTPALIWVGLMMMEEARNISFTDDIADSVAAFLTIVMMPFTYSVENGLMFGFLSWVILKVLTGKAKEVKPMMWISSALFAIYAIKIVFVPGI